jgi:hypothetical protein
MDYVQPTAKITPKAKPLPGCKIFLVEGIDLLAGKKFPVGPPTVF